MTEISRWVVATDESGERVDFVSEAREIVIEHGYAVERYDDRLLLPAFDLLLYPIGLRFSSREGETCSVTIIHAGHHRFTPILSEYQHGYGNSLRESLRLGLTDWARLSLPVLCDATRDQPERCAHMAVTIEARDGQPQRERRILLGPVLYMGETPPPEDDKYPFRLMMANLEAFMSFLQSEGTFGIRLSAMREDGEAHADCSINGDRFEEGIAALRANAAGWPGHGNEVREQYVMFQTVG